MSPQNSTWTDSNISFASRDTIKISVKDSNDPIVGEQEFSIDRKYIRRHSEVLKEVFESEQAKETTIQNLRPWHFENYINWLYTDALPTRNVEDPDDEIEVDTEYEYLVDAYLLGVKLKDRKYRNTALSALLEKSQEFATNSALPDVSCIEKVYGDILDVPEEKVGALREVPVEIFVREQDTSKLDAVLHKDVSPHPDFMRDLVKRFAEVRKTLAVLDACDFHEHVGDGDCPKRDTARKCRRVE